MPRLPKGTVPVSAAGFAPESPQPSFSLSGRAAPGALLTADPAAVAASGADLPASTIVLEWSSRLQTESSQLSRQMTASCHHMLLCECTPARQLEHTDSLHQPGSD